MDHFSVWHSDGLKAFVHLIALLGDPSELLQCTYLCYIYLHSGYLTFGFLKNSSGNHILFLLRFHDPG